MPDPRFFPAKDVAQLIGVQLSTLKKWRQTRTGPRGWVRRGTLVLYRADGVADFLAAMEREASTKTSR